MLNRLSIRNFVLVDCLELDFQPGFSVLTGETGAGKSILVDALACVLGERADSGLVRVGCDRAEVSAEFSMPQAELLDWLRENDIAVEAEEGLLLRRVVEAGGRSRAYLNGSPVTLQQLRRAAEFLVDIHGQHAHQSLLRGDAQRDLLDTHARLRPLADEVAASWRAWRKAQERLEAAQHGAETAAQERDLLALQIRELDMLGFSAGEWEALNHEHQRLTHAARLIEGARQIVDLLTEGDSACSAQLGAAAHTLDELTGYDPALTETAALIVSAQADLDEAASVLRRYAERIDLDPQRLSEAEKRLEAIFSCARKFRVSPEALPGLLADWRRRFDEIAADADIDALRIQTEAARAAYLKTAKRLSSERAKAAKTLAGEVSRLMGQLALGSGRFEIGLIPLDIDTTHGLHGLEQVEFRVSGLAGNETRPLAKVVSGGELSRISLAIQVVTSQAASVPTLIFDEVDVGIGGGVAEVVGRLLHGLGRERQVLCVTHLPQVAACAEWQWQVTKHLEGDSVRSSVDALDANARIEEIARMLGGVEITDITRRHAREMLTGS